MWCPSKAWATSEIAALPKPNSPPRFFPTAALWRKWLEKHHAHETELLVGFYKRDSGRLSISWPESVDAALCFGWIDGVRKRIDDVSYTIRFTPRKRRSIWSAVNIGRVTELSAQGLMSQAGIKAFEAREEHRSRVYSFEQETVEFDSAQKELFQANHAAWKFFEIQPASYKRAAIWWVVNAKRAETRNTRLAQLIEVSEQSRRLPQYTRA